jgi:DNA-binding NarL/FixJ family response regulator
VRLGYKNAFMAHGRKPKRRFRILIADHGGVFRLGLRKVFALEDDLRVVAQAENALQLAPLARKFMADLLFVQAEMIDDFPENILAKSRKAFPAGKIVVTATSLKRDDIARFARAGASGVILKSQDPLQFVACARKVLSGETWLPDAVSDGPAPAPEFRERTKLRPADTLTRREKSIIGCLMQGWRNREIAQYLSITEQTVKNHLRAVYDKLGVSDRLELVLYAIHHRLELPTPDSVPGT